MNTLKIKIPDGYQIDDFDKKTGEVKFKKKPTDIRDRIKTFDDVLEALGEGKDFYDTLDIYPEGDEAAYVKLKLIAEALNEGWKPDWTDHSQYKYFPWFTMGGSSGSGFSFNDYDDWRSNSCCGSRLCFKSRELAEYAGKQFEDVYKEFLTI